MRLFRAFAFVIAAIILVLCSSTILSAQGLILGDPTDEPVSALGYFADVRDDASAYSGKYSFGHSEGDWMLELKVGIKGISASYSYGVYDERTDQWQTVKKTIKNAKVDGFVFSGDGFLGVFMSDKQSMRPAMVLVKGNGVQSPEVGYKQQDR